MACTAVSYCLAAITGIATNVYMIWGYVLMSHVAYDDRVICTTRGDPGAQPYFTEIDMGVLKFGMCVTWICVGTSVLVSLLKLCKVCTMMCDPRQAAPRIPPGERASVPATSTWTSGATSV